VTGQLNVLLSGPGLIGAQHARLLQQNPATRLMGIVAPSRPENLELAQRYDAPLFQSMEDATAQRKFDAAIISSPNAFHAAQARVCIEQRIPTLVEKPFTDTLETARDLAELAEETGVPILVGHHRAYSPLLDGACRFLQSEAFGNPVALQGAALFHKPAEYFVAGPWRTKPGGGPILINLIHEVGLMRFFFGEIDSVFATVSHRTRQFEVEDSVAIALRFVNGALGTFILSDVAASNKSWEMTSGENPRYPHHPMDDCYHFAGTNGSLDFPSMTTRHYKHVGAASWWLDFQDGAEPIQRADPLQRQLDHFVQVVRLGIAPKVSARDGYNNMLVIQAIKDSIESNSLISVSAIKHQERKTSK